MTAETWLLKCFLIVPLVVAVFVVMKKNYVLTLNVLPLFLSELVEFIYMCFIHFVQDICTTGRNKTKTQFDSSYSVLGFGIFILTIPNSLLFASSDWYKDIWLFYKDSCKIM